MTAESNVGARIFLIGKDAALAGLKEIQGAVAKLNATIASGADAAKVAAAGEDVQTAAITRMNAAMDVYKANLAETTLATDSLARIGKYAFFGIASAAAAWGYESVKWAQQYQTALVQLQTQAGLTARAVRQIGTAAMSTSTSNLGLSPAAYLQAIYHPASAGFNVRTSEAITANAAKLAMIGGAPVETTVNAVTGVMRAYNYKANQAAQVTAMTNAIIGAGNMHAATLNAALASGVAASAKTFGVSYRSLGSALAFMTDRGVPASQAGTHLRMTLSLLGAPSAKAATLLKQAGLTTSRITSSTNGLSQLLQASGVSSSELSRALRTNKGAGGIYNAMELLHRTLTRAGLTGQMQGAMISRAFGGGRMGTTIEMMYNSLGTLERKGNKIGRTGTTGRFNKDWAKETATLDYQLHRLDATVHRIGTSFGKDLVPPLTKVVHLFTDMLQWLGKNKDVVVALGGVISAVLVPAIGLYLYRALFKTGGAIRTVLQGYSNLLRGNNAEQIALKKTATQLTLTNDATDRLAQSNMKVAGAARTAAGRIVLETSAEDKNVAAADADAAALKRLSLAETAAGRAATTGTMKSTVSGVGSAVMTAGMYGMTGIMAGTAIRNGQSTSVHYGQTLKQAAQTELGDAAEGAAFGAGIGTIIPGLGTAVGAGIGAAAGGLYGVHSQIISSAKGLWDDVFGGGDKPTPTVPKATIVVHNHLYVDGKELSKVMTKQTRKTVALSG